MGNQVVNLKAKLSFDYSYFFGLKEDILHRDSKIDDLKVYLKRKS